MSTDQVQITLSEYAVARHITDNVLEDSISGIAFVAAWNHRFSPRPDFDNIIITDRYPCYFDLSKYEDAIGSTELYATDEEDFARIYMIAGTDLMAVPRQYRQAALLLVGHYYNMREAENIGSITTEVKEGVHRLLQSVRQY